MMITLMWGEGETNLDLHGLQYNLTGKMAIVIINFSNIKKLLTRTEHCEHNVLFHLRNNKISGSLDSCFVYLRYTPEAYSHHNINNKTDRRLFILYLKKKEVLLGFLGI